MEPRKRPVIHFAAVGIEMGASVLIGILGGRYLDQTWDTSPLFFWTGFSLGIGAVIKTIVNIAKMLKKEIAENDDENPKKS
jgi:F0F1-type ATP synthase assembly protein I